MPKAAFEELVTVMHRLYAPGGCPWDREQTWQTLRQYILEEAYEVVDAIESGDPKKVADEAGDLLMQVVFISEIAQEKGWFEVQDVIGSIKDKLVRRHPHVFGEGTARTGKEVVDRWEELKSGERKETGAKSALDGVPLSLPALVRASKLGSRAARAGFDWRTTEDVLKKIEEELAEVRSALASGDKAHAGKELGDLFFAATQASRLLEVDPEDTTRAAAKRFDARFRHMEQALAAKGKTPKDVDDAELDRLWEAAKAALR